jgi:hypothetical protein
MAEFDTENCWAQHPHVRNCSLSVITSTKVGVVWADVRACVQEQDWTNDVAHPILDRNLKHMLVKINLVIRVTLHLARN